MQLPAFSLAANDGKVYTDADITAGITVLYAYPRDMTPGCTTESQNFRDLNAEFEALGAKVIGVSKDSVASHQKFCAKESLPFLLLSDAEGELLTALGAMKEKSMYGKTFLGIERSTFVVKDGEIVREWRKVKVPGHAQEVLDYVKTIA